MTKKVKARFRLGVRAALYALLWTNVAIHSHWSVYVSIVLITVSLEFQRRWNDREVEHITKVNTWAGEVNKTLTDIGNWFKEIKELEEKDDE